MGSESIRKTGGEVSWIADNFNQEVKPFGRLIAAHTRQGERVYFFDKDGCISLIPAELVDPDYSSVQQFSECDTMSS